MILADDLTEFASAGIFEGRQPERSVLSLVPRAFAVEHSLVPLGFNGTRLAVAMANVNDLAALDALSCCVDRGIEVVVKSPQEISEMIAQHYGSDGSTRTNHELGGRVGESGASSASSVQTGRDDAADAPIIALVHVIIDEAIRRRASDIHVEPAEKSLRIRYRIDGNLVEADRISKGSQAAIVSRIKIMADISIAEKRVPQDGRVRVDTVAGSSVDLRVSLVPSVYGEAVVMRLLRKDTLRPGLGELGFAAEDCRSLERLIAMPDGIVLVTGPTGSGKTMTLYSCLASLNQPHRKIITVEDPVEYQLSGVNQVAVRAEIGMTFASALRAMLRQAPNVVMVGEIRDGETAEIALQASLTGHLVFSTLHTNDAVGAVTRLLDLGAKPFLVATSLRAVVAQRLVRRVCRSCQQKYVPTAQELSLLELDSATVSAATFKKGTGCADCDGSGFLGRIALCELLLIDPELQAMIHVGASASKLRTRAREAGLRTLRDDGMRKVTAGLTTFEEVVSITVRDPR